MGRIPRVHCNDLGKLYMFVLISILPVIVVYLILSKSIIGGITAGAVKQ